MQTPSQSSPELQRYEDSLLEDQKSNPAPTGQAEDWHLKTTSTNQFQDSFDRSFEENSNQHPNAIVEAYQKFVEICFEDFQAKATPKIVEKIQNCPPQFNQRSDAIKLVKENPLLSETDKKQLVQTLKNCGIVDQTIEGLAESFDQRTLNEIIFMCCAILRIYRALEQKHIIKAPRIPSFGRQFDLGNAMEYSMKPMKQEIPEGLLHKKATEAGVELAQWLFHEPSISIVNLKRDADKVLPGVDAQRHFTEFLNVLCKAVFLSAEGRFEHQDYAELDVKRSRGYGEPATSGFKLLDFDFADDQQSSDSSPRKLRKTF